MGVPEEGSTQALRGQATRRNVMAMQFWLKSCPRCHGDLVLEQDRWGRYRVCIQCGHLEDGREDLRLHHVELPKESSRLPAIPARRAAA